MKLLKKNISTICLTSIILIGVILRFNLLGVNPPSLTWDEASLGYNAYSILKTGADEYGNKFPLSIRSFDDFKPALYVYLDIIPIFLFGLNEFAVRLPAGIFGILTVVAVYFLIKEILPKTVALVTAFFFAISPWHLQFARAAFEGNIGFFFFIAGLLFFFKALKNGNFLYISSILFVLSLYSYHSFRLFVPLFLLALLAIFFKRILNFKKQAIISLVILFLLSFPIWNSFLGEVSGTGARLSMVTIFSEPTIINDSIEGINYDKKNNDYIGTMLHNRRIVYFLAVAKGYLDHFNPDFLFIHGDGGVQHHAVNVGMLYLWDIPFILAGIYYLLRKNNRFTLVIFMSFSVNRSMGLAPASASATIWLLI